MNPNIVSMAWEGDVAVVTIDNPPVNTITAGVREGLFAAAEALGARTPAAAVLCCEGKSFLSGADIGEFSGPPKEEEYRRLFGLYENFPFPVVAAMHGTVMGGGLEFALAGSRLVVSPDAQFGQPEMKLGVFAPAASALLPFRVNQPAAEDLLLSGRSVGAAEALSLGIVQAIADDPQAASLEYFDQHLAAKSASSIGFAVRAARAGMLEEAKRRIAVVEKHYLEGLMATHDAVEGLDAFLAKRAASWRHA